MAKLFDGSIGMDMDPKFSDELEALNNAARERANELNGVGWDKNPYDSPIKKTSEMETLKFRLDIQGRLMGEMQEKINRMSEIFDLLMPPKEEVR